MSKTFGQLLDEYLTSEVKPRQNVQSLYMYMEDYQTPKLVINTSEQDYDYTDILFTVVDLKTQEAQLQTSVKALQDKVRQLNKSKSDVEKAIRLLKGDL